MRAVVFDRPGGPEVLRVATRRDPAPGPGEILVAVHAAGVNRADLLQRMGRYPPPAGASAILGLELAGEVVGLGPGSARFAIGDRVMALVTGGGYATHAVVPETTAMPIPASLDWNAAAAIPEAFVTAFLDLFDLGGLARGESVLVHAGASGVGSAAVQLGCAAGAHVLTTAGTDDKLEFCRGLGAAVAIHREHEDFVEVAKRETDGAGVDLVIDFVGAPYWSRNLDALRRGGRLVLVGFLGGSSGELDLGPVLRKSLTVRGTTLRGTPAGDKARLVERFADFALPRFGTGKLQPVVDRVFPLAEAAAAHRYMAGNLNRGKIILEM